MIRNHQKTMCETRWDPQHMLVLARERLPQPAPERRRAAAQVNGDIKNFSDGDSHQFPLWVPDLIVQAAQYISARKRVIILYKFIHNPQLGHGLFVVAFQKKTASVCEYRRLEQKHSREPSLRRLHTRIGRHNGYIFKKAFHEAIAVNRSRIRCCSWKPRLIPVAKR